MSVLMRLLICAAVAIGAVNAPQLSSFDRGNSQSMLKQIKEDLTKNYYDPTFHGMDVEKTFSEASERLKAAKTVGEASAILADTLLRLDDSHTKFYPPERLTRVEYGWSAKMIGDAAFVSRVKKGSDAERKGLRDVAGNGNARGGLRPEFRTCTQCKDGECEPPPCHRHAMRRPRGRCWP